MAGALWPKPDPAKVKNAKFGLSNEFDHQAYKPPASPDSKPFSLRGVLGLGQRVEFSKTSTPSTEKKIYFAPNHLEQELQVIQSQEKEELKKIIQDLQDEIKSMKMSLGQLNSSAAQLLAQPIVEVNKYQVSVLSRIKNFIASLITDINQASMWVDSFSQKKKKKNYFWSTAQNKKKGGQQYMFSSEHSIARSAN
jgi:hypothetical protein